MSKIRYSNTVNTSLPCNKTIKAILDNARTRNHMERVNTSLRKQRKELKDHYAKIQIDDGTLAEMIQKKIAELPETLAKEFMKINNIVVYKGQYVKLGDSLHLRDI